ncbi:MAG: histidinol-phosphatase [Acetobacteraceae bacterium]|nr:histidinol-phosphatase [Acetobacteraceae bacterium]
MLDDAIAAAGAAADAAGAVIRRYFRAADLAADDKADQSPVTVADREAEQAIRTVLARHFPDHAVLGEELGGAGGGRYRWVIDPIDGTRAFITGRPLFGTLLALFDGDRPILGVIDQPVTGERWIGAAGRPTSFRGPWGGTPGCRRCASLNQAELSATSPDVFTGELRPGWERLSRAARRTGFGGDCYAYGLLALGLLDVVVEATMKLWDWGALVPVVEGAGGRITDWQGRALRPDGDGCVLAVGDAALLAEATRMLAD